MDPNLYRRAQVHEMHPLLLPRQDDYRGGWPLGYMGPQCPSDAPVVCKRDIDKEPQGCCPQGQFCVTTISEVYCCPTEADCGTAARNRPVCANPAWTLFGLTSNRYFCCPSNFFGVKSVELSGRGVCEPNLDGFPSSRIASTITRGVGGSAPTGTAATGTGGGGGRPTTTGAGGGGGGTPESTGTSISDSNNAGGGNGGSGGSSISAGVIAGAVVGGVVAILLGVALLLWLHRRSLNKAQAASSGSGPGLGPAMGPAPGPAPTPTTETKFYPPPQPSPSPSAGAGAGAGAGMMHQHQYHQPYPTQPQSQYGSPAMVPTPPPPQYASPVPQPPEAYGTPRYEMPVQAQELGSSAVYPTSRS